MDEDTHTDMSGGQSRQVDDRFLTGHACGDAPPRRSVVVGPLGPRLALEGFFRRCLPPSLLRLRRRGPLQAQAAVGRVCTEFRRGWTGGRRLSSPDVVL